ncbi:MAG TPA: NCS2 family permease [Planctomycetaceae bacterium]|nr:NCS2 family permease [Planctomycetaceae bacterium]
MWDRFFRLSENQTTVRRELLAGLVTFLTMSYILFVNPAILSRFDGQPTGLDHDAVLLATCVASAVATLIMGLYARYPIALAPGMGHNVFFVSVIMTLGAMGWQAPWRTALGIVFIAGVLFLLLSLLGVREAIIRVISPSMKNSIAVGIGLFIALIGLRHGGLVVGRPGTLVGLTPEMTSPEVAVFCVGFLVTGVLYVRRMTGALLWGILAGAAAAVGMGKATWPETVFGLPRIEQSAILQMDLAGAVTASCLPFVVIFLFMDLFDTIGTLIGVAEQAGFIKDNELPRARQALTADAVGTVIGACLGTSTITSYIESAAGVEQGGRTGLTSVTTALLFLQALPFANVIRTIGRYDPITAPALVFVGIMMIRNVRKIDWDDPTEAIPAVLVIGGIPFFYSIADGMALGLVTYPILKLLGGRGRETGWLMYVVAAVLVGYFVLVRA